MAKLLNVKLKDLFDFEEKNTTEVHRAYLKNFIETANDKENTILYKIYNTIYNIRK